MTTPMVVLWRRLLVVALTTAGACAGSPAKYANAPAAAPAAAPAQLTRSLFARDPAGTLTEDQIQRILAAPLDIELPARVGVLPIVEAVDWRGPSPALAMAPAAIGDLVGGLRGSNPFALVTEMMPIPSGAIGMEALREAAARYQLRYVVLYREHVDTRTRVNGWALGYATGLGALVLPGHTLALNGYVEASLFDVKTGLLLFTVRRRVWASRRTTPWHTRDKLARMQRTAAADAAPALAKDLRRATHRFQAASRADASRRGLGGYGTDGIDGVTPGAAALAAPPPGSTSVVSSDEPSDSDVTVP